MFLWLNSTFPDHVALALTETAGSRFRWQQVTGRDVLAAAVKTLKSRRKTLGDLTGVVVVPGPGPFSRVRAGVTVANILSFALAVPLWALRNGKLRRVRGVLAPSYGKPPNITKPHP